MDRSDPSLVHQARRPGGLLWSLAVIVTLAPLVVSGWVVLDVQRGERPPFLDGPSHPGPTARGAPPACGEGPLLLAGSGSNLALTRSLVRAWRAHDPRHAGVVHDSIGSTGGVRAVLDGAVDVGLVSRPLSDAERAAGVVAVPYARVPVVFAAHADVADDDLARAELLALYTGERTTWRDGRPAVVLQRESGDSSHRAVDRALPEFETVNAAAWGSGRWRVLYSDRSMQAALLNTQGAVGLLDLGAITAQDLPLRVLRVDGVRPSPEAVAEGRWPFFKDLAFAVRSGPLCPAARSFLEYVSSPDARDVVRALGYAPLALAPEAEPPEAGSRKAGP